MDNEWFRKLIGIKCLSCGESISQPDLFLVCGSCLNELVPIDLLPEKRCAVCSTNIYQSKEDLCYLCGSVRRGFVRNTSLFNYQTGVIRELVHRFKFEHKKSAGSDIAWLIRNPLEKYLTRTPSDLIVTVPLSSRSMKKRGFNQVDFILKLCGVQVSPSLIRMEHQVRQSELDLEGRKNLIHGQFKVDPAYNENIEGKKIILVDDIYTTGSTVNEIAEVLIKNGVGLVEVLTFFRD